MPDDEYQKMLIERMAAQQDKIHDKVDQIHVQTIKNTEALTYHIKRTDILEKEVKTQKKDTAPFVIIIKILKWPFKLIWKKL